MNMTDNIERWEKSARILSLSGAPLVLAAVALIFMKAPTIEGMTAAGKIFYFHVPVAAAAFLNFFLTFLAGALYLAKRDLLWDSIAESAAEAGTVFCSLALITGAIWARVEWGVWWTWDARLTTTLTLWFIFVAYRLLRGALEDPEKRARVAAVIGIIGFLDVPLVYFSVNIWRTMHRPATRLAPEIRMYLFASLIPVLIFAGALLAWRVVVSLERRILEETAEYPDFQRVDGSNGGN